MFGFMMRVLGGEVWGRGDGILGFDDCLGSVSILYTVFSKM